MSLDVREQVALRLVREGYSARQIAEETGLDAEAVRELLLIEKVCQQAGCGEHRDSPGRPRAGWIRVAQTQAVPVWFCSWPCTARYARIQAAA